MPETATAHQPTPERTILDQLVEVTATLSDLHLVVQEAALVPSTAVGQVLAAHTRLLVHIGDSAANLPHHEQRRWAALAITSAAASALAGLQCLCQLAGVSLADVGVFIEAQPPAEPGPVLVAPDGSPAAARARITAALEG